MYFNPDGIPIEKQMAKSSWKAILNIVGHTDQKKENPSSKDVWRNPKSRTRTVRKSKSGGFGSEILGLPTYKIKMKQKHENVRSKLCCPNLISYRIQTIMVFHF